MSIHHWTWVYIIEHECTSANMSERECTWVNVSAPQWTLVNVSVHQWMQRTAVILTYRYSKVTFIYSYIMLLTIMVLVIIDRLMLLVIIWLLLQSKCICIFHIAAGLACINSTYVNRCIVPQQSHKFYDYFIREWLASQYI